MGHYPKLGDSIMKLFILTLLLVFTFNVSSIENSSKSFEIRLQKLFTCKIVSIKSNTTPNRDGYNNFSKETYQEYVGDFIEIVHLIKFAGRNEQSIIVYPKSENFKYGFLPSWRSDIDDIKEGIFRTHYINLRLKEEGPFVWQKIITTNKMRINLLSKKGSLHSKNRTTKSFFGSKEETEIKLKDCVKNTDAAETLMFDRKKHKVVE